MEDLDPQQTPGDGTEEGQSGDAPENTAESAPQDDVAKRLAELEERNRNLEYRLTQRGRELKKYEESLSKQQQSGDEEFDWTRPKESIKGVFEEVLSQYDARQRSERESRELIKRVARQRGIPETELEDYYTKLQETPPDPIMLADTVAKMYQAEHVQTALTDAAKAAQQNVQRNARAVTTETGSMRPTDAVGKDPKDMTDEELEQWARATYGVADR
jgi:hypothetical protein